MVRDFDLLIDLPPFPAYALPPDAFPGFSAGSFGGSARDTTGIAGVEYVYRPDYDTRGRMLGVSNTRPADGDELLRDDPLWWATPRVRVGEIITGNLPVDAGVVAGVGGGTWERRVPTSTAIRLSCNAGRRFPSTPSRILCPWSASASTNLGWRCRAAASPSTSSKDSSIS